jgi:hypothetical protein
MSRRTLSLTLTFVGWLVGVIGVGAVLGAIAFPVVGVMADTGRTTGQLVFAGVRTLGFFGLVWAPGIALVMTVKKAYETRAGPR